MSNATTDSATSVADRPASVGRMFLDRVAATPDSEAFRHPTGDGWASVTWQQTADRVFAQTAGLLSLGVEPEQRVAIASTTSYEWILADLAIMCTGAATTTVYPSTSIEDTIFILSDSDSRVIFAENDAQVDKIVPHRAQLPDLTHVVVIDGAGDGDFVITLAELEERGRAYLADHPDAIEQTVNSVGPEFLATLIYTSGTTGKPKGVRLVHDNWTYEGVAIDALGILHPDDLQYLWLPLAHSFGKVLLSAQLQIGFATAVDGNVERIVDNLGVIKPTFMAAAPRIFEKVHARIITMQRAEGGAKYKIFSWAFDVGLKASRLERSGQQVPTTLALQRRVADKLVFSKIRHRFGGQLRYFVSGAAALSPQIAEWFHASGSLILEGYGLTETSAFSFVNRPEQYLIGSVGLPAPGTEVRIADDGEVLIKGPGVMRGYHNMPEETAAVLDPDGWLHSGDIGELDGPFLRITDRKKDLIKTSGGKYVAPQEIEVAFKAVCPYASQIVVHGDKRNFVSALVTLDEQAMLEWAPRNNVAATTYEEIVQSPEAHAMVQHSIDELNGQLNRWETIKKFTILPRDLSIEEGEMTPSLKVKRKVVEKKYAEALDAMYVS